MGITFRGSTDRDTVSELGLDIPDPSEKIRAEGLQVLQGRAVKTADDINIANTMLALVQENASIQAQNTKDVNLADLKDNQRVRDALLKNIEQERKNIEIKGKAEAMKWNALSNIAGSASIIAQKIDAGRKQEAAEWSKGATEQLKSMGLTLDEVDSDAEIEALIKARAAKSEGIDNQQVAEGTAASKDGDFIQSLVGLRGYRKLALQKEWSRNHGWDREVEELAGEFFGSDENKFSIETALSSLSREQFSVARAGITNNIYERFVKTEENPQGGMTDKQFRAHVVPALNQAFRPYQKSLDKLILAQAKEAREKGRSLVVRDSLNSHYESKDSLPGPKGYDRAVKLTWKERVNNPDLGKPGENANLFTTDVANAIENRTISKEFGKALLRMPTEDPNNAGGPVMPFEERWGNRADIITDAIKSVTKQEIEERNLAIQDFNSAKSLKITQLKELIEALPPEEFTREFVNKLKEANKTDADAMKFLESMERFDTTGRQDTRLEEDFIRLNNSGSLRAIDVRQSGASPKLQDTWLTKLNSQKGQRPADRQIKVAEVAMNTLLEERGLYDYVKKKGHYTLGLMKEKARREFITDFEFAKGSKEPKLNSDSGAYAYALGRFKERFNDESGDYRVTAVSENAGQAIFTGALIKPVEPMAVPMTTWKANAKEDPNYYRTTRFIDTKNIIRYENSTASGKKTMYPKRVYIAADYLGPDVTPSMVYKAQQALSQETDAPIHKETLEKVEKLEQVAKSSKVDPSKKPSQIKTAIWMAGQIDPNYWNRTNIQSMQSHFSPFLTRSLFEEPEAVE